jgi:hypothetical protein
MISPPTSAAEEPLRTLARIEALRFARHPLFLLGLGLLVGMTGARVNDASSWTMNNSSMPAFLVGVFGCIVAYRLTRSTDTSAEAMGVAPASLPRRTAALCLACLLPGAVGLLWSIALFVGLQVWPLADWQRAGFSAMDVALILGAQVVVACIGGPLLGVATGRWLRFPGAGVLVALMLCVTALLSEGGRGSASADAAWSTALRLFSPYTLFSQASEPTPGQLDWVMRWPGSPLAYLGYQVALCGFAVVVAMLYGADGPLRRRLRGWGVGLMVVAWVTYGLAVFAGPTTSSVHWSDGSVTEGTAGTAVSAGQ